MSLKTIEEVCYRAYKLVDAMASDYLQQISQEMVPIETLRNMYSIVAEQEHIPAPFLGYVELIIMAIVRNNQDSTRLFSKKDIVSWNSNLTGAVRTLWLLGLRDLDIAELRSRYIVFHYPHIEKLLRLAEQRGIAISRITTFGDARGDGIEYIDESWYEAELPPYNDDWEKYVATSVICARHYMATTLPERLAMFQLSNERVVFKLWLETRWGK